MILPQSEQVCSLEYAKFFKEAGVRQDSQWYWSNFWDGKTYSLYLEGEHYYTNDGGGNHFEHSEDDYAAYTVAEFGILLPYKTFSYNTSGCIPPWQCKCFTWDDVKRKEVSEHIEVNARAKLFKYLIENKLLEVL